MDWEEYGFEVGAEAVAMVACDLEVEGPLRTIAMDAGPGVFEKWRELHLEECFNA